MLRQQIRELSQCQQQIQEECSTLRQQNRQLSQCQQQIQEECSTLRQQKRQLSQCQQRLQEQWLEHERVEAVGALQRETTTSQILPQRLEDALAEVEHLRALTQGGPFPSASRSEVHILHEIDYGGWGCVAKGKFRGQDVAIKWPHPLILSVSTIYRIRREVQIMAQVHHPNLIRFIAAVFDGHTPGPLIIIELLNTNLRKAYETGNLLDGSKVPIFRDVAYALHYLHQHQEPIIHRDVSAPNVLLEALAYGTWRAKVSDFGSANLAKLAHTQAEGTIIYAAPETVPQTWDPSAPSPPQTTKIDVYSYGILLCEVITARFPDPVEYRRMLQQVKVQWPLMHTLIVNCTKHNPSERSTMAEILDELNKIPTYRRPT